MTRRRLILAGVALAAATLVRAYVFIGPSWPSGPIVLRLQLDATAPTAPFPLQDGTRSWNAVAQSALDEWNALGGRSRFSATTSAAATARPDDGVNNVTFSSTVYGRAFPSRIGAVTLPRPLDNDLDQVRTVEADVVVNTSEFAWNSYRGDLVASAIDLRRILLHEFGHILGLAHPDEGRQSVSAIMNSSVGLETLQADDIAGFNALYNVPFAKPVITTQPASRTLDAGASTRLEIAVDGRAPPATDQFHSTRWFFRAAGATDYEVLFTLHKPGSLDFNLAQPLDSGDYYYRVVTPDDTVDSAVATLRINPLPNTPTTALANLSTRGIAGSGANPMIVGFVVAGARAKTVLIRAIGPTLGSAFGVPGVLGDPRLTVITSSGADVAVSAAGTWDSSPNVAAIRDATSRVGAFALAPSSRDAVLVATLPPGSYTVRTDSVSFNSGVVLVEAYDADATADPTSRLLNLSTRGFVGSGANLLIAGFVVRGPGPRTYLVRASGDTLKGFGVSGTLDDPVLKLFRADGTLARELDDWDSPGALQPALRTAFQQAGAFAFTDRQESAMLVTLQPGNYTAQISGFVGGSTSPTGVALVEIYEMP